ncbi:MAG: flagellar motor switch protein FliN [Actinomycetota bacterium]|nr:flagellar motor switch protein FliN [Actinomycetota bacterium]
MTPTTQAPGTIDQDAPDRLPLDAVIAHGDDMTRSVAGALSALAADVELELGPTEIQDGPSDLAPAGATHGVMVSLGGGTVVQVAVILDDVLRSRLATSQPAPAEDDPAAPPVWLGAVSNTIDGWARGQGSIVSGALPIERAAELDHLLVIDGGLVLVAAGLFHEGRHAGTVAMVARASDVDDAPGTPTSDRSLDATGGSPADQGIEAAMGSAAKLAAPVADDLDPNAGSEPSRAAALRALADVEMLVTVELGRTRMNVADLLELGPGSVIELDRTAGSPIDLLVNGTLIARGEVVVIDEEYGIRLTEIVGSGEV